MEKVGEDSAAKFISALIKSVQSLCHGYLNFHSGIEIIGHINVSVDKESSLHYILEEKVCKNEENSTLFISNSFHAHNQKCKTRAKVKSAQNVAVEDKAMPRPGSTNHTNEMSKGPSTVSTVCQAVSGSHEKSGSTLETKETDLLSASCKEVSNVAKKKVLSDHNTVRTAKSHLSSSSGSAAHFPTQLSQIPTDGSSPVDTKALLKETLHCDELQGSVLLPSGGMNEDSVNDLGVSLAGSVLEPVGNHSNSDLPHRKDDSDGDLEVTFIKQEYLDGELSACQFGNSGGWSSGRNGQQSKRAASSAETTPETSLYSSSHHHSATATYVPSAHDHALVAATTTAHMYSPSTSHLQPGTSDTRGTRGQQGTVHQLGHSSHMDIMVGEPSFSPPVAHHAHSTITHHTLGLSVLDLSIKTEPKDPDFVLFNCEQRRKKNSVHFHSIAGARSEEARQKAKEKSREYRQKQKIHRMTDSTYDMVFRHQVAERKRRQRMRERIRKLKVHSVSGYSIAK